MLAWIDRYPADDPARLAELRQRYGLPERYLLSVCTLEPRKNLVTLLDAYAAQDLVGPVADGGRKLVRLARR